MNKYLALGLYERSFAPITFVKELGLDSRVLLKLVTRKSVYPSLYLYTRLFDTYT